MSNKISLSSFDRRLISEFFDDFNENEISSWNEYTRIFIDNLVAFSENSEKWRKPNFTFQNYEIEQKKKDFLTAVDRMTSLLEANVTVDPKDSRITFVNDDGRKPANIGEMRQLYSKNLVEVQTCLHEITQVADKDCLEIKTKVYLYENLELLEKYKKLDIQLGGDILKTRIFTPWKENTGASLEFLLKNGFLKEEGDGYVLLKKGHDAIYWEHDVNEGETSLTPDEREKKIDEVLKKVYSVTNGNQENFVNMLDFRDEIGISKNTMKGIAIDLLERGYIQKKELASLFTITTEGNKRVMNMENNNKNIQNEMSKINVTINGDGNNIVNGDNSGSIQVGTKDSKQKTSNTTSIGETKKWWEKIFPFVLKIPDFFKK